MTSVEAKANKRLLKRTIKRGGEFRTVVVVGLLHSKDAGT